MKAVLFVLCVFAISCKPQGSTPFNKLEGDWVRVNVADHIETTEHWETVKNANSIHSKVLLTGIGRSFKGDSLVFQEDISIFQIDDHHFLFVVAGVNSDTTFFSIEHWDEHSFRAVNEENEFPKFIEYRFNQDSMLATIGDESTSVNFDFVRKP